MRHFSICYYIRLVTRSALVVWMEVSLSRINKIPSCAEREREPGTMRGPFDLICPSQKGGEKGPFVLIPSSPRWGSLYSEETYSPPAGCRECQTISLTSRPYLYSSELAPLLIRFHPVFMVGCAQGVSYLSVLDIILFPSRRAHEDLFCAMGPCLAALSFLSIDSLLASRIFRCAKYSCLV